MTGGSEHISRALYERSLALRAEGHFAQAEDLARQALRHLAGDDEHPSPDLIDTLHQLAFLRDTAGFPEEAEQLHRQAVNATKHLPLDSKNVRLTVQALTALASNLRAQDRLAEAEPILVEALNAGEQTFAHDDIELARLRQELGALYRAMGRLDHAAACYREALAAMETSGTNNQDNATIHHLLGELERASGRTFEGEYHARRALNIRETALGRNQLEVARDRALLAGLLSRQAIFEEAELLFRQAIATFETLLGAETPETAAGLHELAIVLTGQRRFDEAALLYERALSIAQRVLGRSHPDVVATLHNWALMCEAGGWSEHAQRLWADADAAVTAAPDTARHNQPKSRPSKGLE